MSPADDGKEYDIYSLGADGVSGGEGQNADISVWDEQ
jgi:general secretion pathway protein G